MNPSTYNLLKSVDSMSSVAGRKPTIISVLHSRPAQSSPDEREAHLNNTTTTRGDRYKDDARQSVLHNCYRWLARHYLRPETWDRSFIRGSQDRAELPETRLGYIATRYIVRERLSSTVVLPFTPLCMIETSSGQGNRRTVLRLHATSALLSRGILFSVIRI